MYACVAMDSIRNEKNYLYSKQCIMVVLSLSVQLKTSFSNIKLQRRSLEGITKLTTSKKCIQNYAEKYYVLKDPLT